MHIKTFCGGYDHNFAYLAIEGKEGALIDPAVLAEEVLDYAKENGLELKFIVVMHSHFDHTVDLDRYKEKGILLYGHKSLKIKLDERIDDGDLLKLGTKQMKVIHTPGHTPDAICLLLDNNLFTSDTLFVGGCGRTDLAGGNPGQLRQSLNKLKLLPENTVIYPGHDYGETRTSTIGKEKQSNIYFR
ncbi:MAG TPA: MBL fold metallo-hydrolase [Candidatus Nanoarchaeia archaeon]|nr:MBL fold metallo-hydrolase [Candidatus Nanoarchaeia archaeon]